MNAADITAQIMKDGQYIERMLGRPAYPGLCLMWRHYSGFPWATVQMVAERTSTSDDTTRRRLSELVGAGRALCRDENGVRQYKIKPDFADQILKGLNLDFDAMKRVPA